MGGAQEEGLGPGEEKLRQKGQGCPRGSVVGLQEPDAGFGSRREESGRTSERRERMSQSLKDNVAHN